LNVTVPEYWIVHPRCAVAHKADDGGLNY